MPTPNVIHVLLGENEHFPHPTQMWKSRGIGPVTFHLSRSGDRSVESFSIDKEGQPSNVWVYPQGECGCP